MSSFLKKPKLLFFYFIFLISCSDKSKIGSEVSPLQSYLSATLIDTMDVKTTMILYDDSISTFLTPSLIVGRLDDVLQSNPINKTGVIEASTFVTLGWENSAYRNESAPRLDSAIMFLKVNYFYGEPTKPFIFDVYKLNSKIDTSTNARFSKSPAQTLGDFILSDTLTPSAVLGITSGASSIGSNTRRINLPRSLSNYFLSLMTVSSSVYSSSDPKPFIDVFPGLAFVPKANATNNFVMGFSGAGANSSEILIFYTGSSGLKSVLRFPFALTNSTPRYNKINWKQRVSPFSNLINSYDSISSSNNSNSCVIQGGIGLRTRFTFPNLLSIKEQLGDSYVINYAELVISNLESGNIFTPPSNVFMYEAQANGKIKRDSLNTRLLKVIQQDGTVYSPINPQLTSYNYFNNTYTIPLTSYVSEILKGKRANTGFVLSTDLNAFAVNKFSFGDQDHPTKKLKFRIYYTRLQKR